MFLFFLVNTSPRYVGRQTLTKSRLTMAPVGAHISASIAPRKMIFIPLERYFKVLSGHAIQQTTTLNS